MYIIYFFTIHCAVISSNPVMLSSTTCVALSLQVNGVSNFQCKLLSPLLTTHGMERQTGVARPLRDLGQPPTFDCAALASRAFSLDVAHVDVAGYGRDRTGGAAYLRETLAAVGGGGVGGEVGGLVPIHADGDGHCLVHALSRALVGRELFWHALRENLATHFSDNIDTYRYLLHDFIGHVRLEAPPGGPTSLPSTLDTLRGPSPSPILPSTTVIIIIIINNIKSLL